MINLLITGDYSPQYRVAEFIAQRDFASIFGEVKSLTSQMDYSVVNFESAVADKTDKPILKCGPNLHCDAKALEAIKWAGFDMVTLANNHFYDYGEAGLEKSFEAIRCNWLDSVGAGRNLEEASKVFYKKIKGKVFAFINCCEHEFSIATEEHGGCNPLDSIQQYYQITDARSKADYVIVIVHGGHEYFQLPSLRMQDTYRFFVDAGADAVVNHHQHCYSGYEFYKGKPIVYGLGNLCFDYADEKQPDCWYEGYCLQLAVDGDEIHIKLHPYVQCKDAASIRFLVKTTTFLNDVSDLNRTINEREELSRKIKWYYEKSIKSYLSILEPYNCNRYLRGLYTRRLLPSLLFKRRVLWPFNVLNCESHLDKLRFSLISYLKK